MGKVEDFFAKFSQLREQSKKPQKRKFRFKKGKGSLAKQTNYGGKYRPIKKKD